MYENKEIKFEDQEKKIPIMNFLLKFLAWVNLSKKIWKDYWTAYRGRTCRVRKRLCKFSTDHSNKKDKTIQEYTSLLKLTKAEYQKLFLKSKTLKEKIEAVEKEKNVRGEKIKKRQYKVETVSKEEDVNSETEEEEGESSEEESQTIAYKKIRKDEEKEKNQPKTSFLSTSTKIKKFKKI